MTPSKPAKPPSTCGCIIGALMLPVIAALLIAAWALFFVGTH